MKSSLWTTDATLTGFTTLGQSGHECNGNEGVLYIFQSSKTGASRLYSLLSYPGLGDGGLTS